MAKDTIDVGTGYTWRLKRGNQNQVLRFDTGGIGVSYVLPYKISGVVWLNLFTPISYIGLIPDFATGSAYKYDSPVILTKDGLCSRLYQNVSTRTPWPNVLGRTKFIFEYSPFNMQVLSLDNSHQPGSVNFTAGLEVFLGPRLGIQAKVGTMMDNYNICTNGCYTAETERASVSMLLQIKKLQLTVDAFANRSTYAYFTNDLFDGEFRERQSMRAVYNYAIGSSLFVEVSPNYSFGWQLAIPVFSENFHRPEIFKGYYSLLSLQWRIPLNMPWYKKMHVINGH